ncbi:uncharacterized protein LOC123258378, partial [Drosophila ananassae]|uniref:uncharacterized protein LOC123258378 n=1 Tax=Drosophila ananassae TaxID=7217 RepID=UPI001CFFB4C4
MEEYKLLVVGRRRLKGTITRIVSLAERLPATQTKDGIDVLLDRLDLAWSEFEKIGDKISLHDAVDGYVDPADDYEEYEGRYLRARELLVSGKRSLEPQTSTQSNESMPGNGDALFRLLQQQQQQMLERMAVSEAASTPISQDDAMNAVATHNELPKIQIKRFSGDYKEWPAFWDIYKSTIHKKRQLSDKQKFHYLKSLLTDEAANLIAHLPITDSAYETAVSRLNERYDRPRHIVFSLLEQFTKLPETTKIDVSVLRKVTDGANEIVRALDAIGENTRDCWIIFLILQKMDAETRRKWIEDSRDLNSPTTKDLFKFLDTRCEEFELSQRQSIGDGKIKQVEKARKPMHIMMAVERSNGVKGNMNGPDLIGSADFLALSCEQRRATAKEKSVCFNCLKPGHFTRQCESKFNCRICHARHHTLLHVQPAANAQGFAATTISSQDTAQTVSTGREDQHNQDAPHTTSVTVSHIARAYGSQSAADAQGSVAIPNNYGRRQSTLPTALVYVQNANGIYTSCRLLFDSGSELSYISERCINALGLARSSSRILVSGISAIKAEATRGVTQLHLKSRVSDNTLKITAHVLSKITSSLQRHNVDPSSLNVFNGFLMADTNFASVAPIDILLGSDYVWATLTGQKMHDNMGNLIAISSIFGWVITSVGVNQSPTTTTLFSTCNIDTTLQRFWEIEEVSCYAHKDPDEDKVEKHFLETHKRDDAGRYIVELPFKIANPKFADTFQGARSRFMAVERRLQRNQDLREKYIKFMQEYISLGHMHEIRTPSFDSGNFFYLPHHPIVGRKLRIVCDGSFKDANGVALNDVLHIGPSIQRNLFSVCLRFRMYRYVFSADIVKMFRQIWVSPDHQNYQRIVWREHPSAPLKHYQLDTVTYGTACAPYLAVRVLEQLAYDHKEQYPTASKILLEDFYVDDVLTGSNNENELIAIRNELLELMSHAKLELDKWVSNSSRICRRESSTEREEEAVKVLGIYWNSIDDQLMYKTCLTSNPNCTKRQILSDVARIFDPLGLLSPIVVQFKIMFQQLWLLDLGWDTKLPPNIAEPWLKCRADLDTLKRLTVPRFVPNREDSIELHAFSDASTKAYAAAVYCRFRHEDGTYSVSLVAAKTRVAPLKQQSLPRLELCGALLLSRLVRSLKDGLRHKDIQVYAWCDSTIVLAWLSYPSSKMKTFVANRTSEILETLPRHAWHHVSSKENPADCASRGMMATQLMEFHLWWNGPTWLHDEDEYTVKMQNSELSLNISETHAQDELRTTAMLTLKEMDNSLSEFDELVHRASSWRKLVHTVGYVLRFIQRLKEPRKRVESIILSFEEIKAAQVVCLRNAQACFGDDRRLLEKDQPLRNRSQLFKLAPYIGQDGLLRVGGRLRQSQLPEEVKHPILLPKTHHITKLILEHEHWVNLHPGTSALFVIVRQRYWIIGARNLIRKVTHNCIRCFRQRHHTTHQLMSDLPSIRITQSLPFVNSGCDYAGPITLKDRKGRNAKKSKGYICLFVCLVTSALHLELATDLSTETFLAALRRFMSLRGKCAQIYSDNGRNFVGARRALDEMQQLLASSQHKDRVSQTLADEGIKWVFIPPYAPHWGGKWESSVRSVKLHLRRVIGNTILTFEQMHTLLAQISAVVNSRPLYYTPDTDVTYLSPAHLLIGRSFTTIPEGDMSHIQENRLDYWQGVQALYQGFWKRWHQEYLTTLQHRPKWGTPQPNVELGSVVLIKDSNTPPAAWPLARVISTHTGTD